MTNRTKLRGKPLDVDCKTAKTTTHEYGPNDDRVFCYGLFDAKSDVPIEKCYGCKAFVENATPLIEAELKPCPFCGGRASVSQGVSIELQKYGKGQYEYVSCSMCGAKTEHKYTWAYGDTTREEAVKAWNRRTTDEREQTQCEE